MEKCFSYGIDKAFAKCLKNLVKNSLYEDTLAFTECILKSVALALQTFFETLCTTFDKRSESI